MTVIRKAALLLHELGGHVERGRHAVVHQDGNGLLEEVGGAVVEGHDDGGSARGGSPCGEVLGGLVQARHLVTLGQEGRSARRRAGGAGRPTQACARPTRW